MSKIVKYERLGRVAIYSAGTTLMVMAGSVMAAVPAEVTTAITGAVTDVATVGAAVLVVIVGIKVFKWIRGAL